MTAVEGIKAVATAPIEMMPCRFAISWLMFLVARNASMMLMTTRHVTAR
jgi:hypothetical protein